MLLEYNHRNCHDILINIVYVNEVSLRQDIHRQIVWHGKVICMCRQCSGQRAEMRDFNRFLVASMSLGLLLQARKIGHRMLWPQDRN